MSTMHNESGNDKVTLCRALIASSEGRFFGATFVKRTDNTERTGTFRTNVSAYVKGVGLSYDPKRFNLQGVWEAQNAEGCKEAEAYRMIPLDAVKRLVVNGEEHIFTA